MMRKLKVIDPHEDTGSLQTANKGQVSNYNDNISHVYSHQSLRLTWTLSSHNWLHFYFVVLLIGVKPLSVKANASCRVTSKPMSRGLPSKGANIGRTNRKPGNLSVCLSATFTLTLLVLLQYVVKNDERSPSSIYIWGKYHFGRI